MKQQEMVEQLVKSLQDCGDFLNYEPLIEMEALAAELAKTSEGTSLELMAGPFLDVLREYLKESNASREFIPKERPLIMCKKMLEELKVNGRSG
jgi:hypothetical protein